MDFVISINLLWCTLRFVTRKSAVYSHYSFETVCLAIFYPQFRRMISRLYKIGMHYFGPFMPDINGEQFCCATCLQRLQCCNYSASKSAWISIQGLLYPSTSQGPGPASLKIVDVMHSNMDDYYSLVFEYHLCWIYVDLRGQSQSLFIWC